MGRAFVRSECRTRRTNTISSPLTTAGVRKKRRNGPKEEGRKKVAWQSRAISRSVMSRSDMHKEGIRKLAESAD